MERLTFRDTISHENQPLRFESLVRGFPPQQVLVNHFIEFKDSFRAGCKKIKTLRLPKRELTGGITHKLEPR